MLGNKAEVRKLAKAGTCSAGISSRQATSSAVNPELWCGPRRRNTRSVRFQLVTRTGQRGADSTVQVYGIDSVKPVAGGERGREVRQQETGLVPASVSAGAASFLRASARRSANSVAVCGA